MIGKKLDCIIVDDEPLALDILENFISKNKNLNLVGRCRNAIEAKEFLTAKKIDLMFLDINMPEISGLTFIKSLDEKPAFIFTTAYSEYALDGFELDALDFLLKPISEDRFNKSLQKALEYASFQNSDEISETNLENDFFYIKVNNQMTKVFYDEISHIEAFADYIKIFLGAKKLVTLQTMKNMENKLPQNKFIRIHRSYIVNQKKVTVYNSSNCQIGDLQFPVGKSYKENFLETMKSQVTL